MRRIQFVLNARSNLGWFGGTLAVLAVLILLGLALVFIGVWLALALVALAVATIGAIVFAALRGPTAPRLHSRQKSTVIGVIDPPRRTPSDHT